MRIVVALPLLSMFLVVGCTPITNVLHPRVVIDWVPFVQFNGVKYEIEQPFAAQRMSEDDLGPEFARVQFNVVDTVHNPQYRTKDGDAAFLAPDTPVFTVTGYQPTFRLAAYLDGHLMLYQAHTSVTATRGADLIDILGKVQSISINSPTDGTTELGAITNPDQIAALVDMVHNAPFDQNYHGTYGDQSVQYFVAFHLHDGTTFTRAYWPETGELWHGITLPETFRTAVVQAVSK